MITTQKVLQALKTVTLPNSTQDVVALGYTRNVTVDGSHISFDLILPEPIPPLVEQAKIAVMKIEGVSKVTVNQSVSQSTQKMSFPTNSGGLKDIKHIIAVSSCKGGVGKSTVAAQLAITLSQQGFNVGLMDADIYGPSIPTLFQIHSPQLKANELNQLIPIEKNNLKIVSFGFLLGDNAAVMRGPIVTRYIQQLLINTAWGNLDYLIIDMPPGTGDIHLTITQSIKLSGAIIVTTPHTLSLIDVARGILMFEKVSVPILGFIENMSYFVSPDNGTKHYIFGTSAAAKLERQFGISMLAQIPIISTLSDGNKVLEPVKEIQQTTQQITQYFDKSVDISSITPEISFNEVEIMVKWPDNQVWKVNNRELRLHSQDALSINEMTGESMISPDKIRIDIAPKQIVPIGNYAINVVWNDGHSAGIYSYELIKSLAVTESAA